MAKSPLPMKPPAAPMEVIESTWTRRRASSAPSTPGSRTGRAQKTLVKHEHFRVVLILRSLSATCR